MTQHQHSCGEDEFPQAIADDYPGWQIQHEDGLWTACCPAVTVGASTASALRAAVEQAIWGTTEHWP